MSANGGTIAWAALMTALVVAYLWGMKRDSSINSSRMIKTALIWVAIIGVAYFLVRALTGID